MKNILTLVVLSFFINASLATTGLETSFKVAMDKQIDPVVLADVYLQYPDWGEEINNDFYQLFTKVDSAQKTKIFMEVLSDLRLMPGLKELTRSMEVFIMSTVEPEIMSYSENLRFISLISDFDRVMGQELISITGQSILYLIAYSTEEDYLRIKNLLTSDTFQRVFPDAMRVFEETLDIMDEEYKLNEVDELMQTYSCERSLTRSL